MLDEHGFDKKVMRKTKANFNYQIYCKKKKFIMIFPYSPSTNNFTFANSLLVNFAHGCNKCNSIFMYMGNCKLEQVPKKDCLIYPHLGILHLYYGRQ